MSKTVLVVDDDDQFRQFVVDALSTVEGLEVVETSDPKEIVSLAELEQPAVILTDVMMPGMLGTELCEQLRSEVSTFEIPIVFMTAWGPELSDLGIFDSDHRADGLLHKPMTADALRAEISRWAQTGRQSAPDAERRQHARAPVHAEVTVAKLQGEDVADAVSGRCRIADISVSGAYITSREHDLQADDLCRLWFTLPEVSEPFELEARVVRVQSGERSGFGTVFESLGDADYERIETYVDTLQRLVR